MNKRKSHYHTRSKCRKRSKKKIKEMSGNHLVEMKEIDGYWRRRIRRCEDKVGVKISQRKRKRKKKNEKAREKKVDEEKRKETKGENRSEKRKRVSRRRMAWHIQLIRTELRIAVTMIIKK